jgi:serine/threonine protein kinase
MSVGPYKLLQEIGERGMGTVFMAEQQEPVRRKVALKIIKPGMDSRQVVARFEAERQALALMDHPNIAKILDAGTTQQGRPYFVMELVRGVPITEFCDQNKLSPRGRLSLFVPVCQAVQHAHQKGVIHRDLKPSNVLVTVIDGVPVPKVIDFGVAKAVGQALTEKTIYTRFAQMIGTPLYMSPEQAQMSGVDVDTRSDIYTLGVLLYELLTGTTPFDRDRFHKAAFDEIRRIIREEEPPRPSTRLTSLGATLTAVSASRGTDPARLAGLVRGELDWVVMKCLEKDRNRRYETASALARDVECYLRDEPVEAFPPTIGYRLRKFLRKHRGPATAAALVLLALLAGMIGTALGLFEAWKQRDAARQAEATADEKRVEAEENATKARTSAEAAEGFAKSFWKLGDNHADAWVEAEVRGLGLQVDLDLNEFRTDRRIGLLRLARLLKQRIGPMTQIVPGGMLMVNEFEREGRRMKSTAHVAPGDKVWWFAELGNRSDYKALREFVTAAVLTSGQELAPLLPPMTHDGAEITRVWLSPDTRTVLTLGKDFSARLWDTRTARLIAVLQKGNERVFNCGYSPDSRTVFTDDRGGVARFWDVPGCRCRAETDPRPSRYAVGNAFLGWGVVCDSAQIKGGRLLTKAVVEQKQAAGPPYHQAPVELWNTSTGRLVARLDRPNSDIGSFQILGGGSWITAIEGNSAVLVFSADDGRLLARLDHGPMARVESVFASPTGRRIGTASNDQGKRRLRMWDTSSWRAEAETMSLPNARGQPGVLDR